MFVAVQGTRDGHAFIADAVAQGAAGVLAERDPSVDVAAVIVPETVAALGALATWARPRLDATVVAITGSTGKTSTKDLTAAALGRAFTVAASPASFNNELGVPLTLLSARDDAEVLVAEVGARGRGQVAKMARVLRPRVGVVTTVGAAHTELFGSIEEVARTKAELLETLPADGFAVVGVDHAWSGLLVGASSAPVLTVGRDPSADVAVTAIEVDGELRPRFRIETPWGGAAVRLEIRGAHQAVNAALAVAAAVSAGARFEDAVEGLGDARGSRWRMEVERSSFGITVVNDAYNANPASVAAALEALTALDVPGLRWAVVGEMAELGEAAPGEHRDVGRRAAELGVDRVVAVGERARLIAEGAHEAGAEAVCVQDADEAAAIVLAEAAPGDAVLVKASRAAGLEGVAETVLGHGAPPRLTRDVTLTDTDAEETGPRR
ncbi:MAG: UDP-N-acetylmuramoyl-tripeptide--D-alanyl-D-alanine ligase [Actinobacteria bacterium]|nr:UDP-N-acetylmuramoyl-tripeptide--D-alanyl-D-alanine ligase [Actinomycetota bacterium]